MVILTPEFNFVKYRIRKNLYGNWYGYLGRTKVAAFQYENDARVWLFLKTGEAKEPLPEWTKTATRDEMEALLAYACYDSEKNSKIFNDIIKNKKSS